MDNEIIIDEEDGIGISAEIDGEMKSLVEYFLGEPKARDGKILIPIELTIPPMNVERNMSLSLSLSREHLRKILDDMPD